MRNVFRAAGMAMLVACTILTYGCGAGSDAQNAQLRDAVLKHNVAEVDRLLSAGAKPDAQIAGGLSALDTGFEILIDGGPWKGGDPPVLIVGRMSSAIRQRNGDVIEIRGTLKPKLLNDARNVGFIVDGFELRDSQGATHALAISEDETRFVNVVHGHNQFPVDFNVQYTVTGVIVNGVLEAEEISAPPRPANEATHEGIVVPVGAFLPSTMDLYRPMLRKKGFIQ